MKPTLKDFNWHYAGHYVPEDEEFRSEFEWVAVEPGRPNDGEYNEIIVLRCPDTGEFWGLEVLHDSWHEESFDNDYEEEDIALVAMRVVTRNEWVFIDDEA